MRKEERFSDLVADSLALGLEHEGLDKDLADLNAAKAALSEAITAKVEEVMAVASASGP